jgi:UDP:flavonoid glycosyltransferase YjiC (YdhE family)
MARIAFAWELGGEFGHAMACSALARALHVRGHSIAFMFRELDALAVLPETQAYDRFLSPRAMVEGAEAKPASFSDIILGCGYANPAELTSMLTRWRQLFEEWKPDLVVADFAPTALLAARTLGLRKVTFGNGFFTPPRADPLPPFRVTTPVPEERLRLATDRALASVNQALGAIGAEPLKLLSEQFATDEDFLCTFPELDHYGSRPESGYWGPRYRFDRGREVRWPRGTGKRVFVYVKRSLDHLDTLIEQLRAQRHRVVTFIPQLDAARAARLSSAGALVSERPVRLDTLLTEADLVICHGGELAAGALMAGVPQFLTPGHYEQYLSSLRLAQLGSGVWIGPGVAPHLVGEALAQATSEPGYAAAARAFRQRYASFSPDEQRRRIVKRIEEILATPAILTRNSSQGSLP